MKITIDRLRKIYFSSSGPIFIVMSFVFHAWLASFFIRINILPVAVLSIMSCCTYVVPFFMKKENLEQNTIFLVFCEIGVFSLLSTMILSMRSGFFLYCLPLPLSSFIEINDTKRKKYIFISATIAMLLLVPLSDLARGFFEVYRERMEPYNYTFLLGNFFVVVASYAVNVYVYIRVRERMVKATRYEADHDALTGLYNRNYYDRYLEISERSGGLKGCYIMIDIDNFKSINDKFGHDVGDIALKTVARVAGRLIREKDILVRWGGEEFVLFIEGMPLDDAVVKAEIIRNAIEHTAFHESEYLTVSIGVTEIRDSEDSSTALKRADENLYVAKTTGKNKVVSS